jgi:hypothetical protein
MWGNELAGARGATSYFDLKLERHRGIVTLFVIAKREDLLLLAAKSRSFASLRMTNLVDV